MKTPEEIKVFHGKLANCKGPDEMAKEYGSKELFDANFMLGFFNALTFVLNEKLQEGEIREHYKGLCVEPKQGNGAIGERNAFAWCLNWE